MILLESCLQVQDSVCTITSLLLLTFTSLLLHLCCSLLFFSGSSFRSRVQGQYGDDEHQPRIGANRVSSARLVSLQLPLFHRSNASCRSTSLLTLKFGATTERSPE
ncbi:uncharacterized protein YALI1_C18787g [Yarrowia lipolytica]|uniref:Uncharacterized protein n=1 Tax=Yarrowia lipolytica TaxID=4952 RepID=A0A1D8NB14_YARLL|nr:hypothetical protein YALI1_C18787g [Yarrowia lipolytica]